MAVVIDASIAAAWAFPDKGGAAAREAGERVLEEGGLVPSLFWFEVRNLLLVGERRGRIAASGTSRFLAGLDALPIQADREPSSADLLALARQHALSGYDAAYLELAQRRAAPLATLDRRLAAAAVAEGVGLLGTG